MHGDADWIYCPVQCGKNTFALTVQSDSMVSPSTSSKSYPLGTVIFIDPDVNAVNGAKVIAKKSKTKEATFKQYIIDGGESYLKPLNPQYPTLLVDHDTVIVGSIIGSFQPE